MHLVLLSLLKMVKKAKKSGRAKEYPLYISLVRGRNINYKNAIQLNSICFVFLMITRSIIQLQINFLQ